MMVRYKFLTLSQIRRKQDGGFENHINVLVHYCVYLTIFQRIEQGKTEHCF